ncbi:MAG: MarR family transcriptional regulator [Candidatus Firestonebacteria bacterium]|nr:MarR family transcriptional regulator [Candidatus Firestonebacteria bacterium]
MAATGVRKRAAYLARIIPEMNKRIHARLSSQPVMVETGLTIAQVHILYYLREHGPAAMTDLAKRTGVALPTMTVTINRLAKSGKVGRLQDAVDRRVVKVHITPRGRKECAYYENCMQKNLEALLQTLKVADQIRLEKAFLALADIFMQSEKTTLKLGRRERV